MGVVYHAQYLVYFDVGRTEYMRERGAPYAALEARGFQLVVVDVGVRYRHPARYDELLQLSTRLADLGPASVLFEYELRGPGGRLLATGHTRLGCLGSHGRPTRLPDDVFEALARAPAALAAQAARTGPAAPASPAAAGSRGARPASECP